MPYLATSQLFQQQSCLLIAARPETTRITSKYRIPHPDPPATKYKPSSNRPTRRTRKPRTSEADGQADPELIPRPRNLQPYIVLKTYDPASGVCLKYKTDKAAEVGRLVAILGKMAKGMVGIKEREEESAAIDVSSAMETDSVEVQAGTISSLAVADTSTSGTKINQTKNDKSDQNSTSATSGPGKTDVNVGAKKKKKGKR